MIIEKLDHMRDIDTVENIEDIREVFKKLIDYVMILEKTLNDTLENLDSDNIAEVDFGRTRYKHHTNTLLNGYAMKAWVTANFEPKA